MEYLIVVNESDKKRIIKEISKKKEIQKIKCLSYKELLKLLYFSYDNETIYYLMKNYHITKEIAKVYLDNLYVITKKETKNAKLSFLNHLYDELLNQNLIQRNKLWQEKAKKIKIVFYHLNKKDKFFQKVINDCKKLTTIEVIDQHPLEKQQIFLSTYQTVEDEVIGVCNKICHLLKNGRKEQELFLANLGEAHYTFFDIYAPMFHLNIVTHKKENYFSNEIVSDFLKLYDDNLEITISQLQEKYQNPNEIEVIEWITSICNKYTFVREFEIKKELIVEELKTSVKKKKNAKLGIREINFYEEEIPNNSIVFVLQVNEGKFPKVLKDEEYLKDEERKELGLNTIAEKNKLEKEKCLLKLQTFANIYLSFVKKDGKTEMYPSEILENISCKQEENLGFYDNSHQYNRLILGKQLDCLKKYGTLEKDLLKLKNTYQDLPYRKYENKYTKVNVEKKEWNFSYSSLDSYFHCAFRFYLDSVLHLNTWEETFDQKIGTLFHEILKKKYESDFDFEKLWKEQTQKIEVEQASEKFFLEKLKQDLKRIIEVLNTHEQNGFSVKTEEKVTIDYEGSKLSGILDKIYLKEKERETLVSIVDYKTGLPSLSLNEVPYGLGLQLPIYLLLLHALPFENIKVIGFYLQKILPTIPERDHIHKEEDLKRKKLMLQGFSSDEEKRLKEFDPSYTDSKLISGMKVSSKGFYPYTKVLSDSQMNALKKITEEKIEEAIEEIRQNKFEINPKRIGQKLIGCDYCKYQPICYKSEKDIVNRKELKMTEFLGGEKNANMD